MSALSRRGPEFSEISVWERFGGGGPTLSKLGQSLLFSFLLNQPLARSWLLPVPVTRNVSQCNYKDKSSVSTGRESRH